MTLKDLSPMARFLNVNVLLVAALAVTAWVLAGQFVPLEKHNAEIAPLRSLPARLSVLEEFKVGHNRQSEQIIAALQAIAIELAAQNQKQDAAAQRLKRIEDKLDQ